jgi:dTDP-4-dehydrorhamnose reductase
VFDGKLGRPMSSPTDRPACAYGKQQGRGRSAADGGRSDALIIRTSAFFGPWDRTISCSTRSSG